MNIFYLLKSDLQLIVQTMFPSLDVATKIAIEIPKDKSHGDLATNAAMIIAAKANMKALDVADALVIDLLKLTYIKRAEVAKPGFINISLNFDLYYDALHSILSGGDEYLKVNLGHQAAVNIEYVSANPTGPMHVGHARCAIYGDALAGLLDYCGYKVTREFYVNDFGNQISDLAKTVYLRYKANLLNEQVSIPQGLYPGEYLAPVAQHLVDVYQDQLLHMSEEQSMAIIKKIAVQEMLKLIKEDLADLGIKHDIFFHESYLHENKLIDSLVEELQEKKLVYTGTLSAPKGQEYEEWQASERLIFKTTSFGDDQDRALQKSDGSWSYYAADLAYAANKVARGYNQAIMVLGADHIGYVARLSAIFTALEPKTNLDIKICQLVNFLDNGIAIKMSKRSGAFSSVRDVTSEVGKDILRFMMLTKKNDVTIDFDLVKVKELSKDNPVFYVQYAYVRAKSLLDNYLKLDPLGDKMIATGQFKRDLLNLEVERDFIKHLVSWTKILEGAAVNLEPHRITYFLSSCAAQFHSLWNYTDSDNVNYRFIIEGQLELTKARVALAKALMAIIEAGFGIIGVKPLEKM